MAVLADCPPAGASVRHRTQPLACSSLGLGEDSRAAQSLPMANGGGGGGYGPRRGAAPSWREIEPGTSPQGHPKCGCLPLVSSQSVA